jgi:putative endonuclease
VLTPLTSRKIGQHAESIAKAHLIKHGLKFITQNYHCRHGEIDLICKDKGSLVFIEVRYRSNGRFGQAFETIDHRKQQKIIKTASYYLHSNQLTEKISSRFDVIGIVPAELHEYDIQWIKNAFHPI